MSKYISRDFKFVRKIKPLSLLSNVVHVSAEYIKAHPLKMFDGLSSFFLMTSHADMFALRNITRYKASGGWNILHQGVVGLSTQRQEVQAIS